MKFLKSSFLLVLFAVLAVGISGCRGFRSEKTPIHLNPNLDWQAKFIPQSLSMTPPEGTVPWGREQGLVDSESRDVFLAEGVFYTGKDWKGNWAKNPPMAVDHALLKRGQERFDIYCAVCHDRAGTGNGPVIKRGFVPPPAFSDSRVVSYTDGEIFDVISNGIRNMSGYKKQIPEADRWAIVTYVRALQKMNNARLGEVPRSMRKKIK